jgi:hypothetical protein
VYAAVKGIGTFDREEAMRTSNSTPGEPADGAIGSWPFPVGAVILVLGSALVAAIYLGPGGSPAYGELRQEILKSTANAVLQLTVLGVIGDSREGSLRQASGAA